MNPARARDVLWIWPPSLGKEHANSQWRGELYPPHGWITFDIRKLSNVSVHFGMNAQTIKKANQDKFDHDKGQKSVISGRRLHWRLSTGFFAFSPVFMCKLVRRAP